MHANCWMGKKKVSVEQVPDPRILNTQDAIIKITSTAICGSDLHLYNGLVPTMEKGDILGHEFMGEVVEVGPAVRKLRVGDRVVVPFPIACGVCAPCKVGEFSLCENSNPNAWLAEKMWGYSPAGLFGYTHMLGGFAGGQAEYARVPFADVGPLKVPPELTDEQVLFLSDIFPTGYMGAEMCNIKGGEVIAVFGAGPVGQFAIASAKMLGAERVIAIDRLPYRLEMARNKAGATEVINYEEVDVQEALRELTGGRGPDAVIDAVGMEAHGATGAAIAQKLTGLLPDAVARRLIQIAGIDRLSVLNLAIELVRRGGTISLSGVYGGTADPLNMLQLFDKQVTLKMGQANVRRWIDDLMPLLEGDGDPLGVESFATHHLPLTEAPAAYETFQKKQDGAFKVVFRP